MVVRNGRVLYTGLRLTVLRRREQAMSTGGLSTVRLGCMQDVMGGHVKEVMDTLQEGPEGL
jgi:hypothetical protein